MRSHLAAYRPAAQSRVLAKVVAGTVSHCLEQNEAPTLDNLGIDSIDHTTALYATRELIRKGIALEPALDNDVVVGFRRVRQLRG